MISTYLGRRALTVAAAFAIVPLAACTAAGEPITGHVDDTTTSASVPTSSTASSVTVDADTTDVAFTTVMSQYGLPSGPEAIDAAKATCDALDSGVAVEKVAAVTIETLGSATDAGYFLGAAVAAYCPRHTGELEGLGSDPA